MVDRIEFQKKVANRIIEIRKQKGISQSELARRCFRDRQNINKLEKGIYSPNAYFLYEIATGLGVTLSELLTGVDE